MMRTVLERRLQKTARRKASDSSFITCNECRLYVRHCAKCSKDCRHREDMSPLKEGSKTGERQL